MHLSALVESTRTFGYESCAEGSPAPRVLLRTLYKAREIGS
ncbi:hypothetical protein ACWGSK_09605 [Nocardiopsis sp. NPDC055551]